MKVVHLVSGSLAGGAARGAYWLHKGLLSVGVDSVILLNHKDNTGDATVVPIVNSTLTWLRSLLSSKLDKLPLLLYRKRKKQIFSAGLFGTNILQHPEVISADVINLHWVNSGYISTHAIKKFKQPVVWTVRDMWPITGGCHYSLDCNKYLTSCGSCPALRSKKRFDLSYLTFRSKQKAYKTSHLTFVGISRWLSGEIFKSQLSNRKRVLTIPNAIDSESFLPIDSNAAKGILGLENKRTVLVGALRTNDFYKGSQELLEALSILIETTGKDFQLLVFGAKNETLESLPITVKQLGYLSDIYSLRLVYSAADVFVAPSKMEAFGKTVAESMSCKTPVVAFDATGPKDIISHMKTGYLAVPYEPEDMAKGIEWLLSLNESQKKLIDDDSRRTIQNMFSPNKIANEYKKLYASLLSKT